MTNKLQTSVTPAFANPESNSSIQLVIQNDFGVYGDTDLHLLLFPAVGAQLACSDGSVKYGQRVPFDVPGGIAQFSNSDTSNLPYQVGGTAPEMQVLYAFNATGSPFNPGIAQLPDSSLKASAPCSAAVKYGPYTTFANELIYTPGEELLGAGGVKAIFGVIAAYYQGAQTLFQTTPFNTNGGNAEYELYRIFSYVVTNLRGEFEKPPLYPANGVYPDKPLVIDITSSIMTERVHEIGYMDATGRGWVREYGTPNLEPYTGDLTYKPAKQKRVTTLGAQFPKELQMKAQAFIASRNLGKIT